MKTFFVLLGIFGLGLFVNLAAIFVLAWLGFSKIQTAWYAGAMVGIAVTILTKQLILNEKEEPKP